MGDHALRQVVGLDLVGHSEVLQLRNEAPMPSNDFLHQGLVGEMIESTFVAVPLAGGIDEREIARMTDGRSFDVARGEKTLLDRDRDLLGEADPNETASRQRIAITDELHRVGRGNDLSLLVALEKRQGWMVDHVYLPWRVSARKQFLCGV